MKQVFMVFILLASSGVFAEPTLIATCSSPYLSSVIAIELDQEINGEDRLYIDSINSGEVAVLMRAPVGELIKKDTAMTFKAKHKRKFGFKQPYGEIVINKETGEGSLYFKDYGEWTFPGSDIIDISLENCQF